MSSTGSNKLEDIFKSRGTYRLTPLSGIADRGGIVTATAAAGVVTLNVSASKVLIDSLPFSVAAGSLVTAPALADGINKLNVYIVPTRAVPFVLALPTSGTLGDLVMLVTPAGKFDQYLSDIYVYNGVAWQTRDSFVSANIDPNKPYVPQNVFVPSSSDFRNLPFNQITGGVLAFGDEQAVLTLPNSGLPPSSVGMGPSYVRFSAGVLIAKVQVLLTGGAIATPATDVIVTRPQSVDLII